MTSIRLIDARLCDDCSCIFDEEETLTCPRCTSTQSLRVDRFIQPIEKNLPKAE
jgi:uncharacterized paraquat-inducible protein A